MEYEVQKTVIGLTQTSDGDIPHKSHVIGDYVFLAPVKVRSRMRSNFDGLRTPVKDVQGRYLYALPGGMEAAL